jgi:AcrR family transcriptional regulator
VGKPATALNRRRERGSISPDGIIKGAFELAEQLGIDKMSMPVLAKHLGVGVTSIYWYFRKKDELLNAMADRALSEDVFATPYVDASDWRASLHHHANDMRATFMANPILCDLILIRGALSPNAARLGMLEVEKAIANLVEAGLRPEDAYETYVAVTVHVRGSVVLHRLGQNTSEPDGEPDTADTANTPIYRESTPLLAQSKAEDRRIGIPGDRNFEYVLQSILDRAQQQIERYRDPVSGA